MNIVDIAAVLVPRAYFTIVLINSIRGNRNAPAAKGWKVILLSILLTIQVLTAAIALEAANRWSILQPWPITAWLGVSGL